MLFFYFSVSFLANKRVYIDTHDISIHHYIIHGI